jgi:hypothetical protein
MSAIVPATFDPLAAGQENSSGDRRRAWLPALVPIGATALAVCGYFYVDQVLSLC